MLPGISWHGSSTTRMSPARPPAAASTAAPRRPAAPVAADRDPRLEGLRAIAILVVVAYHAGLPGFGGGFVGVDVVFVLSGYLITGQLARRCDAGSLDLL